MRFVTYTTVLLSALATVSAYPVSSFFPFGQAQGNWQAGRNDDGAFGPWQFPAGATFPVYGTIQNQISIGNNGIINFASPISTFTPQAFPLNIGPAFTPFWADVDTRGTTGVVGPDENMLSVGFYAAAAAPGGSGTNNVFKPIPQGITDKFRSITDQAFPNEATFTPTLVVVATWDRVGYYSTKLNKRNTFQAVMGSDGTRSFVCFEYARLEWTTGDASGGSNGLGGTSVNAGFNNGDGQFTSLTTNNVPPPLDAQLGLMANSNVGQPGLYCWSVAGSVVRPAEADIDGDPQFAGFQGQQFQFHGLADEHFNLISSPQLQFNSHFVYLSSGNCNYNNTLCYQHPGTYLDVLGLTIPSVSGTAASAAGDVRIKLVAGAHSEGLRVWMSQAESGVETEIKLGAYPRGLTWVMDADGNKATLKYNQFGQVSIKTPMFDINVVNSDFFFNLGLSLLDAEMLHVGRKKHTITDHSICNHDKHGHAHVDEKDETLAHVTHDHGMVEGELMKKYHVTYPLHGLIGQTWRNVRVCGKDWMGRVNDYVVSSLFGGDYYYNFYKSNSNHNVTQAHA